MCCKETHSALK